MGKSAATTAWENGYEELLTGILCLHSIPPSSQLEKLSMDLEKSSGVSDVQFAEEEVLETASDFPCLLNSCSYDHFPVDCSQVYSTRNLHT